jgi:streptomycin 3"-adenylyltransferase
VNHQIPVPDEVLAYARALSGALAELRSDLVGMYLHGSAVIGGFHPARSDVDVLAVVGRAGTAAEQRILGEAIAAVGGCPGAGLELSVITAATAAALGDCPYEVHVNTTGPTDAIATGADRPGDPDLVLHVAVCRQRGLAVHGPPADRVFGPVPRDRILGALAAELRWAVDHASPAYVVLNACRALRYAEEGRLCSKIDGGEWYLRRHPGDGIVAAALRHQRDGGPGPTAVEAARFVADTDLDT